MFTIVRRFRERREARNRYLDHDNFAGYLLWNEDYSDRDRRIGNLGLLAYTVGAMARECAVFDKATADTHQEEASLYLLVEAAETGDWGEVELDEIAASLYRDHKVRSALGCLADEEELREKGFSLLALFDEVTPYVGQSAAVLAIVAHSYLTSSGMSVDEAHQTVWGIPVAR